MSEGCMIVATGVIAQTLKNLHDAASHLIAERDAMLPVVEAATAWRTKHFNHDAGEPDGPELYLAAAVDVYTNREADRAG